ncbi:TetR/AcrR family transcriptional regulator [Nocardia sp. 348MFTsu5.1]|uniref:TetR/AcrR family transcriptional regulator n=1 Tax=Nocardia sp. 348MFTsu5.1 TaxID=1172185 RepID=UPI0003777C61|nr:TetR/AcrR family transcriptional regulator [Nocardia sp. 348MFTsu5.1]
MSNLRAAQKQLTRKLLLTSALDLFQVKGYATTTVDDIANTAGTTRPTFYAYFPSKSDLMKALFDEQLNEVLQRNRSTEHGSTAPDLVAVVAKGTREAIGDWLRDAVTHWPDIRPIIRIGRDAVVIDPALGDLVEQWLTEAISDIEDGLDQAGRFDPSVRYFRGTLAMAELDFVAQRWDGADWKLTQEQMISELIDSWTRLLGAAE